VPPGWRRAGRASLKMMGAPSHLHGYSFREYLDLEAVSNVKHEYLEGDIYAMAGGTPRHAALTLAVGGALLAQLRGGPCRAFGPDLRIRIRATGLATYPDVAVVCGPIEPDPDSEVTVANPRVLVEILSGSTERYDLGEKFEHYRRMPSLHAVLYVWQDEQRMELRARQADDTWGSQMFGAGDTVPLSTIGCALLVDDVYRDVAPPT
jgi:Uma2 family endonuclease